MHNCQTKPSLNYLRCLVAERRRVRKFCSSEHVPDVNSLRVQHALSWRMVWDRCQRTRRNAGRTQQFVPSREQVPSRTVTAISLEGLAPKKSIIQTSIPKEYSFIRVRFVHSYEGTLRSFVSALFTRTYEGSLIEFSIIGILSPGYPCDTTIRSIGRTTSLVCTSRGFSSLGPACVYSSSCVVESAAREPCRRAMLLSEEPYRVPCTHVDVKTH